MRLSEIEFKGLKSAVLAAAVLGLTACGGGGGGGGSTGVSELKQGVVQGLGSYCVDGVKYDDSNATVTSDDSKTIQPGMVVTIKATGVKSGSGTCTDDNGVNFTVSQVGTASAVFYDDEIEGPVTGKDPGTSSFTILGAITIVVDDVAGSPTQTVYSNYGANPSLASVSVTDQVEVSGIPGDGFILATYVEKKSGDDETEVKGFVSSFNNPVGHFTLHIGSSSSSTTIDVDFTGLTLSGIGDGAFVEVEGDGSSGTGIVATKVELEDDPFETEYENEDNVKIHGVLANVAPDANADGVPDSLVFKLIGHDFDVDASNAEFEDGSERDLADGVSVEIKGNFEGTTFVATEVEFRNPRVEMEAQIEGTSATTVTVLGKTMGVNGSLEVRDENGAEIALAGLTNGDFVELRAQMNSDGSLTVTRIEIEEPAGPTADNQEFELRGPVTDWDTSGAMASIEIVGINVDVAGLSDTPLVDSDFEADEDIKLTRQQFFDALVMGGVVEAEATDVNSWDGTTLTANKVQHED